MYLSASSSSIDSSKDLIPFLRGLNSINGTSLRHLINKIISVIRNNYENGKIENEMIKKLLILLSINCNRITPNLILSDLFIIPVRLNESLLIDLRQEVEAFHPDCVKNTIKSLLKQFQCNNNDQYL